MELNKHKSLQPLSKIYWNLLESLLGRVELIITAKREWFRNPYGCGCCSGQILLAVMCIFTVSVSRQKFKGSRHDLQINIWKQWASLANINKWITDASRNRTDCRYALLGDVFNIYRWSFEVGACKADCNLWFYWIMRTSWFIQTQNYLWCMTLIMLITVHSKVFTGNIHVHNLN